MKSKQTKPNCDWMLGVRAWKFGAVLTFVLLWSCAGPASANANQAPMAGHTTANPSADRAAPIPVDQLGAVAGRQYQGDGLSVSATPAGARLRCVFHRLEGEVARTGLWLTSTVIPPSGTANDRFRVVALEVGARATNGARLCAKHQPQQLRACWHAAAGSLTTAALLCRSPATCRLRAS